MKQVKNDNCIKKKQVKIAVVDATGMVGRTVLKVLEEEKIDAEYFLFVSSNSANEKLPILEKDYTIIELSKANIKRIKPNYALLCLDAKLSLEYALLLEKLGCTVIDNSSAFRRDPGIPLIVPECNSRENTINLFTVSDNVRKGAATNAVQILKQLLLKAGAIWA